MPVSQDEFRQALSHLASGVSVVTTKDARGNPFGITVSAFCSVSLAPPLVLVCIEKATGSHHAFKESNAFVVNILDSTQMNISEIFATPLDDKFENVANEPGVFGIPILTGVLANIECRLMHSYDAGDHSIFVGEVERSTVSEGEPLIYFEGEYRSLSR
ncbi:flavin reductase family protein [soil metagenome]